MMELVFLKNFLLYVPDCDYAEGNILKWKIMENRKEYLLKGTKCLQIVALVILFAFTWPVDKSEWIRINQLGYIPSGSKWLFG